MPAADKQMPAHVRIFIASVASSAVALVTHPCDLIKNRMQVAQEGIAKEQYKTSTRAIHTIIKNNGILGLYSGLSASLLRHNTVTTTRLGAYSIMVDRFIQEDGTPPSLTVQFVAGLLSGAFAGIIGNPPDVILVRMTVDSILRDRDKRNYKNPFKALKSLVKEEKLSGLWLGGEAATIRCMVLNVSQVVFYKNFKTLLLQSGHFEENLLLHLVCSSCSAVVSSALTAPFDISKTRMMSTTGFDGIKYKGILDSWYKIVKYEGFFTLWRGFGPTLGRNLPNNILIFVILEVLTKYYKQHVLRDTTNSGF